MGWPTSSAEPGNRLPERTTLTELRSRPVTELPGVGTRIEVALRDLGVASLADMISHYPSRHEDLSNVKKISELRVGERATVVGRVVSTRPVGRPVRGRAPGFSVQLYDGTGYLPATVWGRDRKSTRLNSSHANISYAVFCLKQINISYRRILLHHCPT